MCQVECKFRGILVDSMLCDGSYVPARTKFCEVSRCQITNRDGVLTCTTKEGREVDFRHCEQIEQDTKELMSLVAYLLLEGSTEDVNTILEGRRRTLSGEFEQAVARWVVDNTANVSMSEIALTAVKGGKSIRADQFLVQLNITTATTVLTESMLLKQLAGRTYLLNFPEFVSISIRRISASKQCFGGYTSCGTCAANGMVCPRPQNVLSSTVNSFARVYWNGTTMWHSSHGQFYRPRFMIDGRIGEDALATFRTTDASGVLYFDLGRVIRARTLRINWFQQPAQDWELWVEEKAGFFEVKQSKSRRTGPKMRFVGSYRGDDNEIQDVALHKQGAADELLFLSSFDIRLKKQGLGSSGFFIEEVHLFGEWEEIAEIGVVGVQISSVWWVLIGIAGFVVCIAILGKCSPQLQNKCLNRSNPVDRRLRCGMFDSTWPRKYLCQNCNENFLWHLLQNPRSVIPETIW